jgi:hypothetical protein
MMNDFDEALRAIEQWFDGANQVSDEIKQIRLSIETYCIAHDDSAPEFQENRRLEITSRLVAVGLQVKSLRQQKEQVLGVLHFKCFAKIGFFIQGHKRWKYAIDVLEVAYKETEKAWSKILDYLNNRQSPNFGTEEFEIAFFVDHIGNGWSIPPHTWFGVGRDAYHNVNERLLSELNQVIVELNAGGVTLTRIDTQNPQNTPGNENREPENETQNTQKDDEPFRVELDEGSKVMYFGKRKFDRLTKRIVKVLKVLVENWNKGNPALAVADIKSRSGASIQGSFVDDAFKLNRKNERIHPVSEIIEQVSSGYYRLRDPRNEESHS